MVTVYLGKDLGDLKMPKTDGQRVQPGIYSDGAVMNGQLSTLDAFRREAALLCQQQRWQWSAPAEPAVDPVLRYHLGLDKPR